MSYLYIGGRLQTEYLNDTAKNTKIFISINRIWGPLDIVGLVFVIVKHSGKL